MKLIGNIIWVVFGGLLLSLGYLLGGLVLCLTIVGIPFGVQIMRLGKKLRGIAFQTVLCVDTIDWVDNQQKLFWVRIQTLVISVIICSA